MFFNKLFFIILIVFLLQSCMLTSKMDKIVAEHYAKKNVLNSLNNKNEFSIHLDSLQKINGFCKSQYKSFYTIPLLVYFYSDEKIKCSVNPRIYVNSIVNELNKLIENVSATQKLNNKTIELHFTNVPNSFTHHYSSHVIAIQYFFGLFSLSFRKNEMYYPQDNIYMNYVIRDKNSLQIIKRGSISEIITSVYDRKSMFDSRKYFVANFVSSYDKTMQYSCYQVAQKLINEL